MVTLLLCLFFFVQIGNAQYGGFGNYSSAATLSVRQHIQRQELRSAVNRRMLNNRTSRRSNNRKIKTNPVPKVASGPSSFIFKAPILPEEFFKTSKGTLAEKKSGQEFLSSLWKRYESVALNDGFPSNDLAYVFNYYLVNNYIVYINHYDKNKTTRRIKSNGQRESNAEYQERQDLKINIPIEQKIYDQYRTFMTSDGGVKKMTNEQKQLFAELLVTLTNMAFKLYDEGYVPNDGRKLQIASDAAKTNLENLFGVSVDKIKITEDGVSFLD